MKLVVGLGNPGKKYEATRHNAGFWWVDQVARAAGATFRSEPRFHGAVAKADAGGIWLLKPGTYMNESGRAVAALSGFYRIPPEQVLVAYDELDLKPGSVRLKFGGGLAGHNGLKSIVAHLGTHDFWRLRIGIGHPRESERPGQEGGDYVLDAPRAGERDAIAQGMDRALEVWPLIVAHDMEGAMLRLHTKPAAGSE